MSKVDAASQPKPPQSQLKYNSRDTAPLSDLILLINSKIYTVLVWMPLHCQCFYVFFITIGSYFSVGRGGYEPNNFRPVKGQFKTYNSQGILKTRWNNILTNFSLYEKYLQVVINTSLLTCWGYLITNNSHSLRVLLYLITSFML